jgi:dihydrofolate synthase/folylpolyglutamate synthase
VTAPGRGGTPGPASEDSAFARALAGLADRVPTRMVPDIDRIHELVDLLGSPQRAFPSIHITGTNGKTSTARMADALLRGFGLRPGRYTSPHLESWTERITIDGKPVPEATFGAVYDEVSPLADLVDTRHPDRVTTFELLTAMAFAAFADAPVDVGVVEVGMGGTWDATNVLHAPVAVVTPVALDHRELGATVAEVAGEKAGIVHPGATLVLAQQRLEAAEVLLRRAAEVGATVAREGLEYGVLSRSVAVGGQMVTLQGLRGVYSDVFLPLHGAHQAANAASALAAVEAFLGGGVVLDGDRPGGSDQPLDLEAVREGFASADSPGRLEVVRRSPTLLLDGAHNPAGAEALAAALHEAFDFRHLVGVVAVLGDKDVTGMLEALEPVLDAVVVTQSSSARALPADDLAALAVEVFGEDRVEVAPRLDDALDAGIRLAEEDAEELSGVGVLVTGSIVTVGEARTLLRRR